MIVATAGHVDHGKTTLVRALTGVDTDHAPEAAARGMTIDLGFAAARLDDRGEAVFIDVPGHERFIRNMLAGVAAIDLALLVVAADDGPMAQTREHLAILQLLGVPRLVVALSKCDRVDAARRQQAAAEVAALLAEAPGSPFAGAPVFPLAAATGQGVPALRAHLAAEAAALRRRPAAGRFRLAIDRSFTVDGSGRVVTGAVLAGTLAVGDAVRLMPAGVALRVRALQVLNQPAQAVSAGQRCAVNLAGADLKRAAPARGDWLAGPGAPPPTDRLDVLLQWLPGVPPPRPGPRAQWLLHLGAATRTVRWVPLEDAAPGACGFARLLPDAPVIAAWGDRFILRDAAANRTLAGGRVVDAFGPLRGRASAPRLAALRALAIDAPAASLQALLDVSPAAVDLDHFARNRGLQDDEAAALDAPAGLRRLPDAGGTLGLSTARWAAWRTRLLRVVDDWHAGRPDSLGPDAAALRQALQTLDGEGAPALLRAGLQALVDEGSLRRDGLVWRRPGHAPVLSGADAELLARVSALMAPAGLRPPIAIEIARVLGLVLPTLQAGLARLADRGLLVRVAPNRWYLPAGAAQLEAEARALAAASPGGVIDAAAYRDRTGIGRNLTVQVLEFLDRSGVTRFDGTHHHLRDGAGR